MVNNIEMYVLIFFLYSFLGWLMEVSLKLIETKRFINRGFLIGPYCPIYGCGAVLMTLLLQRFLNDPVTLFLYALVICSILEYFTSWIMEKLFNARWWDYSTKKFNLNGRICAETMIPFGLLGLLIMYVINPFFIKIIDSINVSILTVICVILIIVFIVDCIVSLFALLAVRNEGKLLEKDNTEEMSKRVREVLSKKNWNEKRLTNAFPNARHIGVKFRDKINQVNRNVKDKKERFKLEEEERINNLKDEYNLKIESIKSKFNKKISKIDKE